MRIYLDHVKNGVTRHFGGAKKYDLWHNIDKFLT